MHLNKNNLQLHTANRQNSRGGGLALIWKSHYKTESLQKGSTKSFEYATWRVTAKNRHFTVTGIYHPPYSAKNRITKNCIDDFTIFTSNLLSEYNNNIIVVDFQLVMKMAWMPQPSPISMKHLVSTSMSHSQHIHREITLT